MCELNSVQQQRPNVGPKWNANLATTRARFKFTSTVVFSIGNIRKTSSQPSQAPLLNPLPKNIWSANLRSVLVRASGPLFFNLQSSNQLFLQILVFRKLARFFLKTKTDNTCILMVNQQVAVLFQEILNLLLIIGYLALLVSFGCCFILYQVPYRHAALHGRPIPKIHIALSKCWAGQIGGF